MVLFLSVRSVRKLLVKTVLDKLNTDVTFNGIRKTYSDFIEVESNNIIEFLLYEKHYKNILHKNGKMCEPPIFITNCSDMTILVENLFSFKTVRIT